MRPPVTEVVQRVVDPEYTVIVFPEVAPVPEIPPLHWNRPLKRELLPMLQVTISGGTGRG